jgi:hypothetical protein
MGIMEINRQSLADEFNMEDIENEIGRLTIVSSADPVEIIQENIERANRILDRVEEEMENGNFTARMVEVASAMMNTVTASSKEIMANINYKKYLQIREAMIKYKYDELESKKTQFRGSQTNQNIILTDREHLMKLLGEQEKIEN